MADSLLDGAMALHRRGRLAEAEAAYREMLEASPDHAGALGLLGATMVQGGRAAEGVALIERALELSPALAEAHCNLGLGLLELGRHQDAVGAFERAIALNPQMAEPYNNLGNTLNGLGQFKEAVASFDRALAVRPGWADAHYNRAISLSNMGRVTAALAGYDLAIAADPDMAKPYSNRAVLLDQLGRKMEALASFDQALTLQPDLPEALTSRGLLLCRLRRLEEALADTGRAVELRPNMAVARNNYGMALGELGHIDEAMSQYDAALALQPDLVAPHWNRSLRLLQRGNYPEGFAEYEWRRRRDEPTLGLRRMPTRPWTGGGRTKGKTLFVHYEQGFGDTVNFIRLAALASRRGMRVVVSVQGAVLRLLRGFAPDVEVVGPHETPAHDLHCPMMTLPLALGMTSKTIPDAGGFLQADGDLVAGWEPALPLRGKRRVGIVWRGDRKHEHDARRSIPYEKIRPLLETDVSWVAVHKELPTGEIAACRADGRLLMVGERLSDFSDTAALVAALDLVITVDTAVAHIAGALGKPVWLLLHHDPDWRWMQGREDTPWYDSMRLFRQTEPGNWDAVLTRVAAALA